MEKFLQINSITLAIFGVSIFGIVKYFLENLKEILREEQEQRKNLDEATIAILHNKIFRYGTLYLDRGYITVGELDDLIQMYKPYHDLGGNGTAKTIMEQIKKLPVKKGNLAEPMERDNNDVK